MGEKKEKETVRESPKAGGFKAAYSQGFSEGFRDGFLRGLGPTLTDIQCDVAKKKIGRVLDLKVEDVKLRAELERALADYIAYGADGGGDTIASV